MPNIVLLNNESHRALKVQAGAAARYGDNQRFVPVILGELPHLVAHYPILLTKDSNTGGFFLGAMLGFDEGENLFLTDRGMDSYRPLNLQRGCFFAAGDQVAIDLDSPRIGGDGVALFDDKGEPTPYTQSIVNLFGDLVRGTEQTRQFVATLVALKLLEPIDINTSFDDGSKRTFTGLYTIDQRALQALADDKVLEFFRNGYLQLMHLMMASLKQVPVLANMKNRSLTGPG